MTAKSCNVFQKRPQQNKGTSVIQIKGGTIVATLVDNNTFQLTKSLSKRINKGGADPLYLATGRRGCNNNIPTVRNESKF